MSRLGSKPTEALATCFFLTYPIAHLSRRLRLPWTGAGLIGTIAGLLSFKLLPADPSRCGLVLLGVLAVSIAVSDAAEESLGVKDDPRIVIDEWAGYLISIALLPHTSVILGAAFVLFRVIDVWKPLGIGRLGKLPGGWGIVMDDVAAGLLVNVALRASLQAFSAG